MTAVRSPRERMVHSAAQLMRVQGVAATGMREVVEVADAPRGSLQHYFPDGKDQLVAEAISWTGDYAARRISRTVERMRNPTPSKLYAAMVEQWRTELRASDYESGCPLVAATADVVAHNAALRSAVADALLRWQAPVAGALRGMGVPARRAASLASLMISALEGAIVQARVQQSVLPLDVVARELGPLLDAAVSATPKAASRAH